MTCPGSVWVQGAWDAVRALTWVHGVACCGGLTGFCGYRQGSAWVGRGACMPMAGAAMHVVLLLLLLQCKFAAVVAATWICPPIQPCADLDEDVAGARLPGGRVAVRQHDADGLAVQGVVVERFQCTLSCGGAGSEERPSDGTKSCDGEPRVRGAILHGDTTKRNGLDSAGQSEQALCVCAR